MKVINVRNLNDGIKTAKDILYQNCDKKTVLFLSGGKTPKPLYEALTKEEKLTVGAVGMVDDRYSFHHQFSNEIMIRDSGLISFLEKKRIAFYPILRFGVDRDDTAKQYDNTVRYLFNNFPKRIAILGVGDDGHIASIPAGELKSKISNLKSEGYVMDIEDFPIEPKERITLTFKVLSEMDYLIVLVFGSEKKKALLEMFKKDSIEQVPARFFVQSASKKTILITDQPVSPLARRGGKL